VNGDGFGDVLVAAATPMGMPGPAFVSVFLGSAAGPSPTPITLAAPPNDDGFFGSAIAGDVDVNGDGYADILVSDGINGPGTAYVYLGAAGSQPYGVPPAASMTLPVAASLPWLVSAGDFNGDGYDDVAMGGVGGADAGNAARVSVFLGGSTPLASSVAVSTVPTYTTYSGRLASVGDIDGDGLADLVLDVFDSNFATYEYTTSVAFGFAGNPRPLVALTPSLYGAPQIAGTK
jgi:hypothetical protein